VDALRLVKIGAEAEGPAVDVMEINRPDDLGNANLWGLLRSQCDCLVVVCRAEAGIATTEGALERIIQRGCSRVEEGLYRRPVPAHLLFICRYAAPSGGAPRVCAGIPANARATSTTSPVQVRGRLARKMRISHAKVAPAAHVRMFRSARSL
jgi:hypothetical protein